MFNYSSSGSVKSHIMMNNFVLFSVILKGKPPGTHFTEGNHKQSYTVFDRAGNKATCNFNIRVKGEKYMNKVSYAQNDIFPTCRLE